MSGMEPILIAAASSAAGTAAQRGANAAIDSFSPEPGQVMPVGAPQQGGPQNNPNLQAIMQQQQQAAAQQNAQQQIFSQLLQQLFQQQAGGFGGGGMR